MIAHLSAASMSSTASEKDQDKQEKLDEVFLPEQNVPMSRKEALSPYFTIAAAAFGLISDGCEFEISF